MKFKFESLHIWQKSIEIGDCIDNITKTFPKHGLYSLSDQVKRASNSISLNLAKGCDIESSKQYLLFLNHATRSLYELLSVLIIARRRGYLSDQLYQKTNDELFLLKNMLLSYRKYIQKTNPGTK